MTQLGSPSSGDELENRMVESEPGLSAVEASAEVAAAIESSKLPFGVGKGSLIFIGLLTVFTAISLLMVRPLAFSVLNDLALYIGVGGQLALAAITGVYFSIALVRIEMRVGLSILALAINGYVLMFCTGAPRPDLLIGLLPLGVALPIALILQIIKFRMGSFSTVGSSQLSFQEGLQFQISHLFIATTVVAVLFGAGRLLMPWLEEWLFNYNFDAIVNLLIIASVPAICTLISVWALMGNKLAWRVAIALLVCPGVMVAGMVLIPAAPPELFIWICIHGIPWLAVGVMLYLLRLEGFRFVRKPNQGKGN